MKNYNFENGSLRAERAKGYPSTCLEGVPAGFAGTYGVAFLDEALGGMAHDELVLVGAPSGVGKTQLGMDIAVENAKHGRKVAIAALEASTEEIENRRLFQHYLSFYFSDVNRMTVRCQLTLRSFMAGLLLDAFEPYREKVRKIVEHEFLNLEICYKLKDFNVESLLQFKDEAISKNCQLIIIDHIHYFDYDMEKESKALTEIIKVARDITQIDKIPMVILAQLRKKNFADKNKLRSIDDFHGSSNVPRNATTTIVFSPGEYNLSTNLAETYMQIHKDRAGGDAKNFIGKCFYSIKEKKYLDHYMLGTMNGNSWEIVDTSPRWAKSARGVM